jgi:hypothetical protein
MDWLDNRFRGALVRKARLVRKSLVCVLAAIGLCFVFLFLRYQVLRSRETELRQDLQTMRKAIDNFTLDAR